MRAHQRARPRAGGEKTTNLGDIEVFARVAASRSMTAAARELGLGVAAVSKRIQRLEVKVGARLIERTTRRLTLTEAGQGFHERVARIFEAFEEAVGFASEISTSLQGTLRITAPTSFGRMHLAPYIPRFLEAHPSLQLELDLSDHYVDIVARGFHVAIRIGDLPDSPWIARKLAPVRRVLCAAPSYVAKFGEPQDLDDLARHHLLAPESQEAWLLQGPEGSVSVKVRGRLRTNSSEVVREAVLAGCGIALRSTWDVGPELAAGRLTAILPRYRSTSRMGLFAVFPSKDLMPLKVRRFIDFLADLYGPDPYWDRSIETAPAAAPVAQHWAGARA
ncbi:MAG TPA: LysR family transcriptional regulator [Microvirga sp.]|nr:LysR family transcriptional regulator [Microvirga sp.]